LRRTALAARLLGRSAQLGLRQAALELLSGRPIADHCHLAGVESTWREANHLNGIKGIDWWKNGDGDRDTWLSERSGRTSSPEVRKWLQTLESRGPYRIDGVQSFGEKQAFRRKISQLCRSGIQGSSRNPCGYGDIARKFTRRISSPWANWRSERDSNTRYGSRTIECCGALVCRPRFSGTELPSQIRRRPPNLAAWRFPEKGSHL
jgi:hypothetical protein